MVARLTSFANSPGENTMTTSLAPSYPRSPSTLMKKLLDGDGFLSTLCHLGKRTVQGCNLDVHLRMGDEVSVYCGLTKLVTIKRKKTKLIGVSAAHTYTKQECAQGLFRDWNFEEADFECILHRYLDNVKVAKRWTSKEGLVQTNWSRVTAPWIPFDREAVLRYGAGDNAAVQRPFSDVESARSLLKSIAIARPGRNEQPWAEPSDPGTELDQLAIDGDGNLVIVEIKYAGKDAKPENLYYAPLQLLQYVHEWRQALGWISVWSDLKRLIEARNELGLTPDVPKLTGGIRAAVCFGEDRRSDEVKRRYYEALGVVNAHLPAGVQYIETWCLDGGEARPL